MEEEAVMDTADVGNIPNSQDLANLSSKEDYLEAVLGAKYLPMYVVIPLTLAYVSIFLTGVFGNVVTCLVIIKNPKMQTATNYYLFSLAISDLTLLILGLPNELSTFWQQYPWTLGLGLCKLRAYVSEMSSYVSVLTIVAFSMERYLAICHPLHLYAMSGLKRPVRFILAAWLLGLICAIPFGVYTKINYIEWPPESGEALEESAFCSILLENLPDFPLYQLSGAVFFLLPMAIILLLYARMGLKIHSTTRNTIGQTVEGQIQSRKGVIRMLSAVVVMFFLCWAPFHAQRLLYVYGQNMGWYVEANEWLFTTSGILYYFSTTVNPIVYNIMSAKYRGAFKELLCCSAGSGNISQSKNTSSYQKTSVCQCDSGESTQLMKIRSPKYPRSVRCTIDHAKEILRTPDRVRGNKDPSEGGIRQSRRIHIGQNGDMEPICGERESL